MLERLLQMLRAGGTHTIAELARELEVSEALVELMMEDLVRMGYLAVAGGSCDRRCTMCPPAEVCAARGPTRVWTLTRKGQEAAGG